MKNKRLNYPLKLNNHQAPIPRKFFEVQGNSVVRQAKSQPRSVYNMDNKYTVLYKLLNTARYSLTSWFQCV